MRTLYKNLNSTRTVQTRPVWPVGPTGQTGRPHQMPNLAVNICPPCFLVSFTSQKARTILMYLFHTGHTTLKNKTKGDIQYRPSSSSRTLPNARIEFLQVSPIDSYWQTLTLHRLHHIWITGDNLDNLVWTLPTWRPLAKLVVFHPNRQNCLPSQIPNQKRFKFIFLL